MSHTTINILQVFGRKNLVNQLVWSLGEDPFFPKLKEYRAPSWSWVSVDDSVTPFEDYENNEVYVQILEVSTVPIGLSSFGEVSGGSLKLKCDMLIRFKITQGPGDYWIEFDFPQLSLTVGKNWDYLWLTLGTFYILPRLGDFLLDGSRASLQGVILTLTGKIKGRYERVGSYNPFLPGDSEDMTEVKDYQYWLDRFRELTVLRQE